MSWFPGPPPWWGPKEWKKYGFGPSFALPMMDAVVNPETGRAQEHEPLDHSITFLETAHDLISVPSKKEF